MICGRGFSAAFCFGWEKKVALFRTIPELYGVNFTGWFARRGGAGVDLQETK